MDKFEERLNEYKSGTTKISKLRLKLLELKYRRLKDTALYNATKADYNTEIYNINKEYFDNRVEKKKMETSKMLMWFIVFNCTMIELYSMWAMIHLSDLSPLTSLIAAVITESVSFIAYCVKAYFGKRGEVNAELERENLEFEKEKLEMIGIDEEPIIEDESVVDEEFTEDVTDSNSLG